MSGKIVIPLRSGACAYKMLGFFWIIYPLVAGETPVCSRKNTGGDAVELSPSSASRRLFFRKK
jgi:hypothetical protein